jgi:steroid 5-alpha reductase family enzyme
VAVTEADIHTWVTRAELILAAVVFVVLLFVSAPYGRHHRSGWGPTMPNAIGWAVMESPALVLFGALYLLGRHASETVPLVLAAAWMLHYTHRAVVFPLRMRTQGKRMPVTVAALAFAFNCLNAYVVGRWISHLGRYAGEWLRDPRFIVGMMVFAAGFWVNIVADRRLIALREPGETGYSIPRGWLFDYVAAPNYLGEIVEWTGYAVAMWSLPGAAFALFTVANMTPRALAHRRWYRETFPDYPTQRRALIPFVV